MPADGKLVRGVVAGHGYGGRPAPDPSEPGPPAVSIYPCARGFDRSARADIPNHAAAHVRHGIGNRGTYVHRGCAADLWCAASALIELYPEIEGALHYTGFSFGGGIGALALPWDKRFRTAYLDVPSFGNHPLRVQLPSTGSGESVRLYYKRHPEVLEVLAYFDAATAARHIHIPVFALVAGAGMVCVGFRRLNFQRSTSKVQHQMGRSRAGDVLNFVQLRENRISGVKDFIQNIEQRPYTVRL